MPVPRASATVLLATGAGDGTIRLWDPVAAEPVGEPLTGPGSDIYTLAQVAGPDRRPLLAAGGEPGDDRLGRVVLVDPLNPAAYWPPLFTGDQVVLESAVAVGSGGRTILATCGMSEVVSLWDLTARRPLRRGLRRVELRHTEQVGALAAVALDGTRDVFASVSDDGSIWLWETNGDPVRPPIATGYDGPTHQLLAFRFFDGRTVLASCGEDGSVRLIDPVSGRSANYPLIHDHPVLAMALYPGPDGRTFLATSGTEPVISRWDPVRSQPIGEPIATGHTGAVHVLRTVPGPAGRVLLATTGADGTVRLWDPNTGQPHGEPLLGHTDEVFAMCTLTLP